MKLKYEDLVELALALMFGQFEAQLARMSHEGKLTHYLVNKHALPPDFDMGLGVNDPETRKRLELLLESFDPFAEMENKARSAYLSNTQVSRAEMRSGLMQGINDMHSSLIRGYFDEKSRQIIEQRLAAKKLPPLGKLLIALDNKHRSILKRGKIRNDEEYYIVQNILADLEFPISAEDRDKCSSMVATYFQH